MASTVSSPKAIPVATNGIVLLHIDFLLTGIVMTFLGPMLPQLSARWSLTDVGSGGLIFAQFFSSMFGMLLSAVTVKRLGYRITLIIGLLLMTLGMALLASGPWMLGIVAVCTLGVGYGITTPAGNLRTAEVNPARSASALNVINAVWGVGAMSSPFLVEMALRAHRPSLFPYGTAMALAILLLVLGLTRFVPDTHAEPLSLHGKGTRLWHNPTLALICALFFVYVGTETCFGQWVATYAKRIEIVSHALATLTPSFFWGALLLGRALAPIALKFRTEITVVRSGLVLALMGGFLLVAAHGLMQVIVGAFVAGLGMASVFPISVSMLTRWFGDSARAASSPVFASGNTGGAVLPWVLGLVSAHYASLRLAFCVPLAGAAAMLLFYLVQKPGDARARVAAS